MDVANQPVRTSNAGNYRIRIANVERIDIRDLYNPWNFFNLMNQNDENLNRWLIHHNLLLDTIPCTKHHQNEDDSATSACTGTMRYSQRSARASGASLRCTKNRNHEIAIRTYSFFEASKLCIQGIFMFLKCYLDGLSLLQTCTFSGVHYKSTGVDWASFIRELFKEHFHRNIKQRKLSGIIEIDESLFGRRVKYHRGNPNKGLKVWVFGLVETSTNTIILYPVESRSREVLLPIIERHVQKGSTIYSDGWTAYCALNELGYRHFSVLHKYAFRKSYRNLETGEIISVHTNRIEGAWKHAKDHFRKMSGTKATQWEGHLAEIMWRAEVKSRRYEGFFYLLRSVYTLQGPPEYRYSTPLFDSWSGPVSTNMDSWTVEPLVTDAEETSEVSTSAEESEGPSFQLSLPSPVAGKSGSVEEPVFISSADNDNDDDEPPTAGQRPLRRGKTLKPATVALISDLFSDSSLDDTIVEQPAPVSSPNLFVEDNAPKSSSARAEPVREQFPKRNKTDNVCHPKGFLPTSKSKGRGKGHSRKRTTNPYTKNNFFVWSSSDDDFQ